MTVSSIPMLLSPTPTRGFLYIGDPHVWSKKPGRRRDDDFLATILGKLGQAAEIANRHHLWPICPGDLLHDDDDHDPVMLLNLTRALQKFDRKMICLVGNHDKDEAHLSERNSLLLLGVAGQLHLIDRSGFCGVISMHTPSGEMKVAIGGTPYGDHIPQDVASFLGAGFDPKADVKRAHVLAGVDTIVWMTHEDLAFQGAYPGAKSIEEIRGVDACFNGHMHGTSLPHKVGMTSWYNPGNITRMSVDTMDHKPSVWEWLPLEEQEMGTQQGLRVPLLHQHILNHVQGEYAFTLEGLHATAMMPARALEGLPTSAFAERLLSDRIQQRSDDGTFTRESLETILEALQVPDLVKETARRRQEQAARNLSERA